MKLSALAVVTLIGSVAMHPGDARASIDEAANRAALQDQVGNRCPGVEPDYVMRAVLVAGFKKQDPHKWAAAYGAATRELVGMLSDATAVATVCEAALDLYGPKGTSVPKLLKPAGQ